MWTQRLMCIAWPAFLMAAVLEMVVFAFVDPLALDWMNESVSLTREGIYTMAFFVFWLVIAAAGVLTALLSIPPTDINHHPEPAAAG